MNRSGLPPGPHFFAPMPTGAINREFKGVAPGEPHCYDAFPVQFPPIVVLLELPPATTLRLERVLAASCEAARPSFGPKATLFER